MDEITRILEAVDQKGQLSAAELLPLVYDELRSLASQRMSGESSGHTLQATALVHEAWLRLSGDESRTWVDRNHFYNAAAQAMRRILVTRARAKSAGKRGSKRPNLDISRLEVADSSPDDRVLLIDEMLERLEAEDPDSARLISLKFFGGMTNREIATMDGVTERTIERRWTYGRGRLYQMICAETE